MDLNPELKSIIEWQKRSDWDKWKATIEAELRSLFQIEVFGPTVPTPPKHPCRIQMGLPPKEEWTWSSGKAGGTRVHVETRHRIWWDLLSCYEWHNILISHIYGSYLEFENVVDGCGDRIFVWVTWFGNLYESPWRTKDPWTESKPQHVPRPPAAVVVWVETIQKDVVQPFE